MYSKKSRCFAIKMFEHSAWPKCFPFLLQTTLYEFTIAVRCRQKPQHDNTRVRTKGPGSNRAMLKPGSQNAPSKRQRPILGDLLLLPFSCSSFCVHTRAGAGEGPGGHSGHTHKSMVLRQRAMDQALAVAGSQAVRQHTGPGTLHVIDIGGHTTADSAGASASSMRPPSSAAGSAAAKAAAAAAADAAVYAAHLGAGPHTGVDAEELVEDA
jgi:hypothetical protein